MATANVRINQILLRRGNTTAASAYTGPLGEAIVDTGLKTLRVQDGVTAGGTLLATDAQIQALGTYANATFGTSSFGNANVQLYLNSQNITSANIGAFQTYANLTFGTQANAATQAVEINSLRANITAANVAITGLTSNAAIQAAILDTLTGNAATQATVLDSLTANAASQATTLTTLLSNAVAQQTSLTDLVANAATQAQAIANVSGTYSNTNVAAYLTAVTGNIIPSANVTYSLGDATHQWKDLWVSNNTIYIGNTPIRVDGGTLLVNNAPITGGATANLVNGSYTVSLDSTGNIILPGSAIISGPAYDIGLYAGNDGVATAGTVNIATTNPAIGQSYNWQFNSLGELELPQGGLIKEGGGPFGSSITLEPANTTDGDQVLVVYPTFAEGNHLHLTTGNLYNTELYLGSDNYYVKLTNSGTIAINANDNTSSQATWEFMPLGDLRLPQGGVIGEVSNPSGFPGYALAFTPDPANAIDPNQQLLVYPTGGADFNHLHLTSGDLYNTELFLGNDNLHVKLANTGDVEIRADDNAGNVALWTFGKDGRFTAPGDVYGQYFTLRGGNGPGAEIGSLGYGGNVVTIFGTEGFNVNTGEPEVGPQWQFDVGGNLVTPTGLSIGPIQAPVDGTDINQADNEYLTITSKGLFGITTVGWAETPYSYSNVATIDFNSTTDGAVKITTGNNFAGSYNWRFDATGNLTLPGNIAIVLA
jgi:hypothetical protein